MKFSKIALSISLSLVFIAPVFISANAQQATNTTEKKEKKDRKKDDAALAVIPPAPPTPFSEVRRDALLNGLPIVSLAKSGDAMLRCDLVIRSGAMFDLAGKTGLARLTQETLLAANPRLAEELESLEAKMQWGVTLDLTWYRLESPAKNFSTALEIIGRLLVVETIRPEAFKAAYEAQLQRIRTASLSPAERADAAFLTTLYGTHPYGHNVDGTEKTIAAIQRPDISDFYKKFYLANNAVVVLTGDVRHDSGVNAFKAFFGSWVKGAIVPMTFRQPDRVTALRLEKVEAPGSGSVELRGGVLGVRLTDPDFIASRVLAGVLDGRLKKEMTAIPVENLSVRMQPHLLTAPFYFAASVTADRAPEFSRKATDVFAALATSAVTAEELAAAQNAVIAEFNSRLVEDHLREVEFYNLPRNFPLVFTDRVRAVTAADVQRVARRLLDANALTIVVMGKISEQFKSQL